MQISHRAFAIALNPPRITMTPIRMASVTYQEIKNSLRNLYLDDPRPWLVGFSGGKDSTMVASLVFDAVLSVPPDQRKKPVAILCTDTRVEIPAVAEGVESALERMRRCSHQHNLNIQAQLLKPPARSSADRKAISWVGQPLS
jgi:3'-phosphoadenosine 5'-phosphosulfate sulfotransferase (PAPS reductase)/FAD synthetase